MSQGKKIIQPPYLKEGDKVALIAPAYWVAQEALSMAADVLKGWGLCPVVGEHTNSLNVDAYSGTADERVTDLIWAFEDDDIKAIFCSRGGYGSIHLLGRVDKDVICKHPKWLVGHGDITVLLNATVAVGMMCIHGPMAFQIAASQEPSITITRNILFGNLLARRIEGQRYLQTLDQQKIGKSYEMIITSLSGLYRYKTHKIITVVGRYHGIPTVIIEK